MREEKRKQRLQRAVPVKDWWRQARKRFMAKEMGRKLVDMYQSSARISPAFTEETKSFWALPDDFNL